MHVIIWIIGMIVIIGIAIVVMQKISYDPLERDAKDGDTGAQFTLALQYYDGTGGRDKDRIRAAYWFGQAAAQDHAESMMKLGWMHEHGAGGLEKDREEAVHWYKKAAQIGQRDAQKYLGLAYFHGRGIPQNYFESYCWLNVARAGGALDQEEKDILKKIEESLDPNQILHAQKESVKRYEQSRGE